MYKTIWLIENMNYEKIVNNNLMIIQYNTGCYCNRSLQKVYTKSSLLTFGVGRGN